MVGTHTEQTAADKARSKKTTHVRRSALYLEHRTLEPPCTPHRKIANPPNSMPCVAAPENASRVSWQATLSAVWLSSKPSRAVRRIIYSFMQVADTDTHTAFARVLLGSI